MPGYDYLRYIGLPDWYPQWSAVEDDLDDALLDAAEGVIREWTSRDPLLAAALDGRWDPWAWESYPVGELPVGTRVRLDGWDGEIVPVPDRDREWYPGEVQILWRDGRGDRPHPYRKESELLTARLPVPLDLAGALATLARERAECARTG